jgi:tRNA(fMet)-specific endonuclease VapC
VDLGLAYEWLQTTAEYFCGLYILPFDAMARLHYQNLLSQKIPAGKLDLRIAAIALTHNAIVVSRNRQDFDKVPGLRIEDWSR